MFTLQGWFWKLDIKLERKAMNIKELIAYSKTFFYINKNSQSLEFLGHTLQPGKGQKIKREVLKSI